MNIIQKPSPNFVPGRGIYKPEVIVLHIMAGTLQGTDAWFMNPNSKVSAHFGVGFNGEIHQYVRESDTAWANGIVNSPSFRLYKPGINPNLYTLSIEHEGFNLTDASDAERNGSVELIKNLCATYNIPIDRDHIIGHYEIDLLRKPNCPSVDKSIIDAIVAKAKGSSPANRDIVIQIQELLKKIS